MSDGIGWVSLQELRNVFTHELRELDKVIMPEGGGTPWGTRMAILKHVESIQYRLMQRAKANYEMFLPVRQQPKASAKIEEASAKPAHEERLDSIKRRS